MQPLLLLLVPARVLVVVDPCCRVAVVFVVDVVEADFQAGYFAGVVKLLLHYYTYVSV